MLDTHPATPRNELISAHCRCLLSAAKRIGKQNLVGPLEHERFRSPLSAAVSVGFATN